MYSSPYLSCLYRLLGVVMENREIEMFRSEFSNLTVYLSRVNR
jgi:hypothetical protein